MVEFGHSKLVAGIPTVANQIACPTQIKRDITGPARDFDIPILGDYHGQDT
jgi:hypothetical protein